jgi:hypothetical protein
MRRSAHSLLLAITLAGPVIAGEPLTEALDAPTTRPLSLGAVFNAPAPPPVAADTEPVPVVDEDAPIDAPTTPTLTLRSLLAVPTPTPSPDEAASAPRERETRLATPLRWATTDPDNRVPFRAPPAEWFRAPQEVLDDRLAKAGRPDPMLELIRLNGGRLPRLAPRGQSGADKAEHIRQATAPFFRIVQQESTLGSPPVRLEIVNASREMPARVVIEPLAPPPVAGASEVALPPAPPLVMLMPPGSTERLSVDPGLYRFQRFVWSARDITNGRAKSLLAESFDEQDLRAGATYQAVLAPDDERKLRRALEK